MAHVIDIWGDKMNYRRAALGACVVAGLIVSSACGAQGDDDADSTTAPAPAAPATTGPAEPATQATGEPATPATGEPGSDGGSVPSGTSAEPGGSEAMFGTLESPCGPGDATIAEGQNGDDGVLRLAAANDHTNQFTPGLTQEMLDASQAFAAWCNEQGGIQGLQIEVIDMDGRITEAAAAMEMACNEVFAMVGGGLVLDDQEFPRFHECGMIDFAGYTVTAAKALSNGMVQPIPNPPNHKPAQWLLWGAEAFPEAVKNTALMYTDIATTENVKNQLRAAMKRAGWNITLEMSYALGEANYAPFAQRLKDEQITALSVTGSPEELVPVLKAMDAVGYRPELILQEANFYDKLLIERGGKAADGVYVRTAYAPFEEPGEFPGMASYLDMMKQHNPDGKRAGLGLQATSAHLLFATAANECLDSNNGVLERECVLKAGKSITSWTGGGLHTETNPAENLPPACGIIMQVRGGKWQRAYPELGSPDDNGNGWNCRENGVTKIPGTFGDYELGVDPDRPN